MGGGALRITRAEQTMLQWDVAGASWVGVCGECIDSAPKSHNCSAHTDGIRTSIHAYEVHTYIHAYEVHKHIHAYQVHRRVPHGQLEIFA